jgi:Protein of unknown function (DUF1549)/Planctomycete cytochrome C
MGDSTLIRLMRSQSASLVGRCFGYFVKVGLRFIVVLLSIHFSFEHTFAAPDFESDIVPILEAHCLSCHNGSNIQGDVRLDRREYLMDVISVDTPDDSLLIERVSGPEPAMPKKQAPLTVEQVRTLRAWIAAGAEWPDDRVLEDNPPRNLDWWSLKPIANKESHTTNHQNSHPVDRFLDASMASHGLQPVAEAEPSTLIRRLTYDLTGLPPSPEEVKMFVEESYASDHPRDSTSTIVSEVNQKRSAAYLRLVDRLLASPAFGEKWGRHWLDIARYAETHGYDKDKPRMNAWPYRDYVIRAFNEDKPYDRFVQEQIAGDALFPIEPDGVLGLGFLAAGPWDFIGHSEVGEAKVDGRIAKHLDRDEMITAVFNVFTSTTVQCAQCHHHKFDPVRMQDYYRLHAVFAAVDRADRVYTGLSMEQMREQSELVKQINELKAEQDMLDGGISPN